MPFTPSHVAAALPFLRPFTRAGLPSTGLVIGCMVPDLPYYLPPPLHIDSRLTHTATGVLTVDLGLGLVCVALWHGLIGPLAVAVAPAGVRARARRPRPLGGLLHPVTTLGTLLGLAVGAFTHVWWDAFTHRGRFGARHVAWLAESHGYLPGYRWAQYASGLLGAAVVLGWAWAWWRATQPRPAFVVVNPRLSVVVWTLVLGCLLLGAAAGAVVGLTAGDGLRHTLYLIAVCGGGSGAAAALLSSIALRPVVRRAFART